MDAAPLRLLLDAARSKSAEAAAHLHPHWAGLGWRRLGLPTMREAAAGADAGRALCAALDLRWPGLDVFALKVHRIALLPRSDLRRVLGVVALHFDRHRVRLSIGPGLRAALVDCLGDAVYASMLEAPPLRTGIAAPLTPHELEPERLALNGLLRLVQAKLWRCPRLLRWTRMALAPADAPPPKRPLAPHDLDTRLPIYFPEQAWLFGSPMDHALSASTMA